MSDGSGGGGAATHEAVGEWRALRLIAAREITEALRRKAVWLTAGLFLLASTALVVLPDLLGGGGPTQRTVATAGDVTDPTRDALEAVAASAGIELDVVDADQLSPREEATDAVASGDADALVRVDTDPPTVVLADEDDAVLEATLREGIRLGTMVDRLAASGLTESEVRAVMAPVPTVVEVLDTERGGRQFVALVAAFVTYLLLLLLTMQVANGVAVEKSGRISEVLLAVVTPRALLFGKATGVGVIGLVTLAAGALPVVTRLAVGGSLPPGTGPTVVVSVLFSLLGLALFMCVAGALGALVERTEEVSGTVGPVTSVLIVGFLVGQIASGTPLAAVLSYVPLTSPMVMPIQVALDEAGPVDVAVSAVILAVTVVVAARFAITVYRRAIVRTGTRLRLRDLRGGAS